MWYAHKTRVVTLTLVVSLAIAYLALMATTLVADSKTTTANVVPQNKHRFITLPGGDFVYNWDYRSQSSVRTNVDWGMRLVFADNATTNKVKNKLDGEGSDPNITPPLDNTWGAIMHGRIQDNDHPAHWDSDMGKKNTVHCGYNWGHARFYATGPSDYNQNSTLGHYIVATLHADLEEGGDEECDNSFRSHESDEQNWIDRVEDNLTNDPYNWSVGNSINWYNSMPTTDISGYTSDLEHSYQSNGYGKIINVP